MDLRPMTQSEFETYLGYRVQEYGESKAKAGFFRTDEALERSRAEYQRLLPAGLATPGMVLFSAVEDDEPVGMIWLALPAENRPKSWIFDVRVHEARRGKGYGRAIMLAVERELAGRGIVDVELNVFGHNEVARKLYESLGYEVVAQTLAKRFRG